MANSKENSTIVTTTISKGYQVTVPSIIRKALGLLPGDPVDFKLEKGYVAMSKAESREERIRRVFAELDEIREREFARMTPAQKKFAKEVAGWTAKQYRDYIDNLPETKQYVKEKYGV